MMGNLEPLEDAEGSFRWQAQRLVAFITGQLSLSEEQARERAHLATCGDRPFAGYSPCHPDDAEVLSGRAANRAAATHPETPERPKP